MLVVEAPVGPEGIEQRQGHIGAFGHCDRNGTIELHDGRRRDFQQDRVQAHNLIPVRQPVVGGLGVHRGNRRLYGVCVERPRFQRFGYQGKPLAYLLPVPEAPVLLPQQHDVAVGVRPRGAP